MEWDTSSSGCNNPVARMLDLFHSLVAFLTLTGTKSYLKIIQVPVTHLRW